MIAELENTLAYLELLCGCAGLCVTLSTLLMTHSLTVPFQSSLLGPMMLTRC